MQYKLDPMLPWGCNENDSYFDDGVELFDDGVPRPVELKNVERDPLEVERIVAEIEAGIPADVLELFNGKRKKEEVA